jgi:hypothetical protein
VINWAIGWTKCCCRAADIVKRNSLIIYEVILRMETDESKGVWVIISAVFVWVWGV